MKIGIYNPYFDSLSGGERYVLELAHHWSLQAAVSLFCDEADYLNQAQKRFNLDLSRVKITQNIFRGTNLLSKIYETRKYDLIFFLTDGSVPTSFARHNILHFQVPFAEVKAAAWKANRFEEIVCNSFFTKKHLDPSFGSRAVVIYPPVHTQEFALKKKEKIILSVGRFTDYFQSKKQEVLIQTFRSLKEKKLLSDWRLILVGGLLKSDEEYFEKLKKLSQTREIELVPNISYERLKKYYETATIYWHAAGFGQSDPTLMEHFGISTVEAMAAGAIPVVYNGGGLPEIVTTDKDGFLWNTVADLARATLSIVQNTVDTKGLRESARCRAKDFDCEKFYKYFDELLVRITS